MHAYIITIIIIVLITVNLFYCIVKNVCVTVMFINQFIPESISKAYLRVSLASSLITSATFGNSSFMSCLGLDEVSLVLPAADDVGPLPAFSFMFLSGLSSFSVDYRLKSVMEMKAC